MLIQKNGMTYDSEDARCKQSIKQVKGGGGANSVAIIKCFDSKGYPSIYYGIYNEFKPEESIAEIMAGGADFYATLRFWKDELES